MSDPNHSSDGLDYELAHLARTNALRDDIDAIMGGMYQQDADLFLEAAARGHNVADELIARNFSSELMTPSIRDVLVRACTRLSFLFTDSENRDDTLDNSDFQEALDRVIHMTAEDSPLALIRAFDDMVIFWIATVIRINHDEMPGAMLSSRLRFGYVMGLTDRMLLQAEDSPKS